MAYLAIEKQAWPFTTLEGFANSDYGMYLIKGSVIEDALRVSVHT